MICQAMCGNGPKTGTGGIPATMIRTKITENNTRLSKGGRGGTAPSTSAAYLHRYTTAPFLTRRQRIPVSGSAVPKMTNNRLHISSALCFILAGGFALALAGCGAHWGVGGGEGRAQAVGDGVAR